MATETFEAYSRKNLTATGTINGTGGALKGIFVASASATPTIKVADEQGTIANTFTPAGPAFYELPCRFNGDLTITISGTVDCTVFYKK
jgi:hypothetical protein